ncbi:hypothetical protein R8510_05169 [Ralstonia chuxiongensis]|nr:hypothetical protein R8510_05169 [Ralstonia chuxiongensis]
MSPSLQEETYVYCCAPADQVPTGVRPIATFREAEGLTLIIPRSQVSRAELSFQFECALITLNVHSSLDGVGFIAMISASLAKESIACNVMSAYHHDHLFVPFEKRERAMQILRDLAAAE